MVAYARRELAMSIMIRHSAQAMLHSEPYVHALGALTGNQAMQQVRTTVSTAELPVVLFGVSVGQSDIFHVLLSEPLLLN